MAARHILYLSNESLVSLFARGGQIAARAKFSVDASGMREFERHLQGLPAVPTHLITDLAEEDFRVDTIPHLGGRDQRAVLGRKLLQIYRGTTYKYAVAQGRESEGRRDDRVIYAAITNPDVLQPWVETLERLHIPLAGIHSSAIFSGRLLARLRLAYDHALLVTLTPGHAIRQTYFRGGEIRFSRLTPVDQEAGQSLGDLLAGEIARTWQYLDGLRYFMPTDRLEACVLVHANDRPGVEPALIDYEQVHFHLLNSQQVATQLGMKKPPGSSSAEEILAHLFLKSPAENHFAPPEIRRFAALRSARNAIGLAAGGILAAGLVYAGTNLYFVFESNEQDSDTRRQVEAAHRELAGIRQSTPLEEVGGQTMRDTVAFYSQALHEYPNVSSMLGPLSMVFDRYPKIRLTQIAWQAADDDKATPTLVPMTPRDPPRVTAVVTPGASPGSSQGKGLVERVKASLGGSGENQFSFGNQSIALLEGTVVVDGLDFRRALALLDALVADIGRIPGYQASLVDSPLDVTSQSAIKANLGEKDPTTSQARFSLRVSRETKRSTT